jgi:hypothetical protein
VQKSEEQQVLRVLWPRTRNRSGDLSERSVSLDIMWGARYVNKGERRHDSRNTNSRPL